MKVILVLTDDADNYVGTILMQHPWTMTTERELPQLTYRLEEEIGRLLEEIKERDE